MLAAEKIMRGVRRAMDSLTTDLSSPNSVWTLDVKTALGITGKAHDCWVCSAGVPAHACDSGEWLYDVAWLSYQPDGEEYLLSADLVVECEWNPGFDHLDEDFQKLLLARATVRLMIFDGGNAAGANRLANHLARQVAAFRCSRDDDVWLLAAWVGDPGKERGWSFRWFTVEKGTASSLDQGMA